MNWKNNLKNIFKSKDISESQFILGIDLGDSTSAICYYDILRKSPEVIDISGGYGKISVPTALQYIHDTKEWIFGEYAILNEGSSAGGTMFGNMIDKLGTKTYLEIGDKLEPLAAVLSIFIKELLANCKNINPKAEIAGIVVSIPDYMPVEAKSELLRAFAQIGYDKKIIDFVPHRECILTYHYHNRKADRENVLVLDYGSRELRAGIYEVRHDSGGIKLSILSYFFDESLGTKYLDGRLKDKFIEIYKANVKTDDTSSGVISESVLGQINTFAYQHKDAILQKHLSGKGMRIYYNFTYPPFYYAFTSEDAENIIKPFRNGMKEFLKELFKNNQKVSDTPIDYSDISTVVCTGGGFEMLWARELIQDLLPDGNVYIYKNSKAVNASGASIIAAGRLGAITEKPVFVEDSLQVRNDIGVILDERGKKKFYPIIEQGSFWWQNRKRVLLIVNSEIDENFQLSIHKRDDKGDLISIGALELEGLPKRPKGATQLDLRLEYIDSRTLKASIKDKGFGSFFSESGQFTERLFEFS